MQLPNTHKELGGGNAVDKSGSVSPESEVFIFVSFGHAGGENNTFQNPEASSLVV